MPMGKTVFHLVGKSTFHPMGKHSFRGMGKFTCHLHEVVHVGKVVTTLFPVLAPVVEDLVLCIHNDDRGLDLGSYAVDQLLIGTTKDLWWRSAARVV